jgi:hypothetical protein
MPPAICFMLQLASVQAAVRLQQAHKCPLLEAEVACTCAQLLQGLLPLQQGPQLQLQLDPQGTLNRVQGLQ